MLLLMARQLHAGDLIPKKQVDIENAMNDWASKHGHDVSDNLFRPAARKLFAAVNQKDKN